MIFKIPVKVSVQCVCGAKLDAVLVDDPKYDFSVVVDNTHICPAAEHSLHVDACPACKGKRYVLIGAYHEVCEICHGTGKRQ